MERQEPGTRTVQGLPLALALYPCWRWGGRGEGRIWRKLYGKTAQKIATFGSSWAFSFKPSCEKVGCPWHNMIIWKIRKFFRHPLNGSTKHDVCCILPRPLGRSHPTSGAGEEPREGLGKTPRVPVARPGRPFPSSHT